MTSADDGTVLEGTSRADAVDAHLAALDPDRRVRLAAIRATARAAAPGAVEVISYGMPGLRLGGRLLVSYDAFARHVSLFPASGGVRAALGDDLAPYLSGKGTIAFPHREQIPLDIVRRVVEARVAELRGGADG